MAHLREAPPDARAAALVSLFRAASDAVGTPSFGPRAAELLARLVAENHAPSLHAPLGPYTLQARSRGGYTAVGLYEGRLGSAAAKARLERGDPGLLATVQRGPRVDRRILAHVLAPGPASAWAHLPSPVADAAANVLEDPGASPRLVEAAARIDVKDRPTAIPLETLRSRTTSLGETCALFLVTHGYSQSEASRELGLGGAAQIRTLLRRARSKLAKEGG